MPRLLLLTTDLLIGGTPAVVRELAVRLRRGGRDVEVACLAPRGPNAEPMEQAGVTVHALGAAGPMDVRIFPRLLRLVWSRGYDTVLSFLVHANAVAGAIRPFAPGVRFLQSIQTTQPRPRWHWWAQAVAALAAERIVVPSPSVADIAVRRSRIPRKKIEVIPNAVDPAEFEGMAPPQSRPFPIGFLGRLDPVKNIPDLLEAVRELGNAVHLHIFGEGEERHAIERRIDAMRLMGRVTLHGAVADPRRALERVGLLVLPSQAEGFGLVLIEAMAAGIPVVATDVPGIGDVVEHGRTGLLVPVNRPAALADAILRLMADAGLRERLASAGRDEVRRRFSWEAVLPQYRRLLA